MKYLLDHTKYINDWIINKESCTQFNVYHTNKKELLGADSNKAGLMFKQNVSEEYINNIKAMDKKIYEIKEEFSELKFAKLVNDYNKETNRKYDVFKVDLFKAYDVDPNRAEKLFNKSISEVGSISRTKEIEQYFAKYVDLII